ncbi:hypothetical protein ACFWWB_19270 [Streptomyces sp. NPDC058690]|uniref:hypothetical protein n=1 Tax=Streptomyces sp. NPDC058690 TaxID=3346600 RepID=UPI003657CDB3
MKKHRLCTVAGILGGIAFGALAVINLSAGDSATALRQFLDEVLGWTASGVLVCLDGRERDRTDRTDRTDREE